MSCLSVESVTFAACRTRFAVFPLVSALSRFTLLVSHEEPSPLRHRPHAVQRTWTPSAPDAPPTKSTRGSQPTQESATPH